MTKREAAIISAYTGILIGEFEDMYSCIEEIMERPVSTYEIPYFKHEIKLRSGLDIENIEVE